MKTLCPFVIISIAAVGALQAQQPQVQNAKVETRAVAGGLEATLRTIQSAQSTPVWVGYAVPIVAGDRQSCCWNNNSRGCFLEPSDYDRRVIGVTAQPVKLEGPTHLVVLYRFENRQVSKIRTFTPECELDAGGLPFLWLTGVSAPESIRALLAIAKDTSGQTREQLRHADGAVSAIALHADPAADAALEELLAPSQPEQVRRQAIFWLGNARGQRGFQLVSKIVREDPATRFVSTPSSR